MYLNLGNPGPDFLGSVRKGDNLYSDSMVALDISGAKPKMKWYHQFIPHDTHDWDPPMQPVLFTGKVDNATREAGRDRRQGRQFLDPGRRDRQARRSHRGQLPEGPGYRRRASRATSPARTRWAASNTRAAPSTRRPTPSMSRARTNAASGPRPRTSSTSPASSIWAATSRNWSGRTPGR